MSGWTALTLHVEDDDTADRIDQELRNEYQGREPPAATGYADCTVQLHRGASHKRAAENWAEKYPEADTIAVVSANDTSDSGSGTLFRVTLSNDGSEDGRFNEHPVKEIDSKQGYEGARGSDVTGYFRDEYGVRSYESWEA